MCVAVLILPYSQSIANARLNILLYIRFYVFVYVYVYLVVCLPLNASFWYHNIATVSNKTVVQITIHAFAAIKIELK